MNLLENYSLRRRNTFGFDVQARYFAEPRNTDSLRQALSLCRENRWPLFVLGGGSNLVLTGDIPGLTLRPAMDGLSFREDGDAVFVEAGAGVVWDELVQQCVARGYWGLENLSLIPGSAGAAPVQNIGAYGVELADRLEQVVYLDTHSGESHVLERDAGQYSYRNSIFKQALAGRAVITQIRLRLSRKPTPVLSYQALRDALGKDAPDDSIGLIRETVIAIRRSKLPDPEHIGNAGSFFQNPTISADRFNALRALYPDLPGHRQDDGRIKTAAAWFVDKAGWKGHRENGVGVHDRQAIVLINTGRGNGLQICELAARIQADVLAKFDIELEIEPRIRP
ncbi:UDP-N-acetylmuramate dehydrogenase [Granulosicoccaceae sp. 1_MG-2023]|nr:UDP-N-acetylmuramate dehydrogenase [Granulosicoccaceae sp. 1_MG-2023]